RAPRRTCSTRRTKGSGPSTWATGTRIAGRRRRSSAEGACIQVSARVCFRPAGAYLAGEVHVRGDDVDPGVALLERDRGAGRVGEAVHAGAFTGPLPVETLPLPQHDDGAAARPAVVDGRSAGHVRGAGDLLHVGLDDDDVVRHDLAFGVGVHRRL